MSLDNDFDILRGVHGVHMIIKTAVSTALQNALFKRLSSCSYLVLYKTCRISS